MQNGDTGSFYASRTSINFIDFTNFEIGNTKDTNNNTTLPINNTTLPMNNCSLTYPFKTFYGIFLVLAWMVTFKLSLYYQFIKQHDTSTTESEAPLTISASNRNKTLFYSQKHRLKTIIDKSNAEVAAKANEEIDAEINKAHKDSRWLQYHNSCSTLTIVLSLVACILIWLDTWQKEYTGKFLKEYPIDTWLSCSLCLLVFFYRIYSYLEPDAASPSTNPYSSFPIKFDTQLLKAPRARFELMYLKYSYNLNLAGDLLVLYCLYTSLNFRDNQLFSIISLTIIILNIVGHFWIFNRAEAAAVQGLILTQKSVIINSKIFHGFYVAWLWIFSLVIVFGIIQNSAFWLHFNPYMRLQGLDRVCSEEIAVNLTDQLTRQSLALDTIADGGSYEYYL